MELRMNAYSGGYRCEVRRKTTVTAVVRIAHERQGPMARRQAISGCAHEVISRSPLDRVDNGKNAECGTDQDSGMQKISDLHHRSKPRFTSSISTEVGAKKRRNVGTAKCGSQAPHVKMSMATKRRSGHVWTLI